jgi:parvulin-like peptidyl-prolyl isomerase
MEDLVKAGVQVSDGEAQGVYAAERQQFAVELVELTDQAKAKETADKVTVALGEGKDFAAAAQAAGLTLKTLALGPPGAAQPGGAADPKDQALLRQAAATLKVGQVSSLVQGAGTAYLLRVTEKKVPSDAEFEKDKVAFRRVALERKRQMVFEEWLRAARRTAKVSVDRQALGG